QIGGGVSRNAVIGKMHRLGLPGRGTTSRTRVRAARKHRRFNKPTPCQPEKRCPVAGHALRAQIVLERAAIQAQPDIVIPAEERQPILVYDGRGRLCANAALDERACRWTYGDGTKDDPFYCCGKEKVPGLPYCDFHSRRAFNPLQPEHRRWPSHQGYVRHVADLQTLETLEPA